MKIIRGFKFRLYPTAKQEETFGQYSGVCRLVYNLALEQRGSFYRQFKTTTGKNISFYSQSAELTALRSEFDWVRAVAQTCQQEALKDLDVAFGNFFNGRAGYPAFRRKNINDSFRFRDKSLRFRKLNANWGLARLPKIGDVRFRMTRDIPGKIKSATVNHGPLGWTVSFLAEYEIGARPSTSEAVGIDRGIVHALSLSDGSFIDMPRERLKLLDRKARKHAKLASRKRKGSARRNATKRLISASLAKAARVREHFLHEATSKIASSYGIVCIEALATKRMTASAVGTIDEPGKGVRQKAGLNKSILDIGWYKFEELLSYKILEAGGEVRKVNPRFTSTTCSSCCTTDRKSRKSQAVYECSSCGFLAHADTNAAINILRAGTQPAWTERTTASLKRKSSLQRICAAGNLALGDPEDVNSTNLPRHQSIRRMK